MTSLERWSLHLSAILTGVTGWFYGYLRYYGQRAGEFGVEPHPYQATLQHLHVLVAPLLVFALGMLVRGHVLPRWRAGGSAGRVSGVLVALIMGPMVLSGYAVQVAVEPPWRLAFAWVHGVSSLLFLVGLVGHLLRPLREPSLNSAVEEDATLNPS